MQMQTRLGQPLPLGIIQEVDGEGLKASILLAALELDVFNTIAAGHQTLAAIAQVTESSPRGMAILLNALCPLGLLTKVEDRYALTLLAATFLVRGQPTYCADMYYAWWKRRERLVESIRTGTATMNLAAPEE